MFHDLREFIMAVAYHWSSLVTGGLIIGILSIWQGTGHPVPHSVYWVIAVISLFVAFFKAWRDERSAKEAILSQVQPAPAIISQPKIEWRELYDEKKRLEKKLETEIRRLEPLQPRLMNGMMPDDPNAFYLPDEAEYSRVCRKIDRIKEEIEIIKGKLRDAP